MASWSHQFSHADLQVLNTNFLWFVYFINLQRKTLTGQQFSRIVYRFGEASTLSSEARAPRLWRQIVQGRISLVEKGICGQKIICLWKSPRTCLALHSMDNNRNGSNNNYFGLLFEFRWNWFRPTRIMRITVNTLTNTDIISYCYFNGQRSSILQDTSFHQRNS